MPGFISDLLNDSGKKKIRCSQQELCFFGLSMFSLDRCLLLSSLVSFFFFRFLDNGISHCTLEYLPTQHRCNNLPPLLSYTSSLLFPPSVSLFPAPSLDWFNCTVSVVSAAAADVGHIESELGARPPCLGSGLPLTWRLTPFQSITAVLLQLLQTWVKCRSASRYFSFVCFFLSGALHRFCDQFTPHEKLGYPGLSSVFLICLTFSPTFWKWKTKSLKCLDTPLTGWQFKRNKIS